MAKGGIPGVEHETVLRRILLLDFQLAGIRVEALVVGDGENLRLMFQIAVLDVAAQTVPVFCRRRYSEETVGQVHHAAHIICERLGTVLCQIVVVTIRTLGRGVSMDIDAAHLQVLVLFQGIDGAHDAVQLGRVATVVGVQFDAVYREVDVGTLVEMAHFDSLHLGAHEVYMWLTGLAEDEVASVFQVATSAKILVHGEVEVSLLFGQWHSSQIFHGLRLLVVAAHHKGLV